MFLNQSPVMPDNPLPIVIIGAGGIVRDAHLPAYEIAKFPVAGIYDASPGKAQLLVDSFGFVKVAFDSPDLLFRKALELGAVYDLAVPADQILKILERLPDGSAVLIQKPMGENLEQATKISDLCRKKALLAAVNFQLRHAPFILAARDLIHQGLIGEVFDIEFKVGVHTPWELWEFLKIKPRVEILYHSIHYVDTVRAFFGDPSKVYANTIKHPNVKSLAATRSTIVLDYGGFKQARILTNHGHNFGSKHQESYLKIEGTHGAIKIQIGVSFDYPKGRPSKFEYYSKKINKECWQEIPLTGDWFPHAFIGPMASLQNQIKNPLSAFSNSVEDAFQTMSLVEKLYESNEKGGLAFK
jgi:predicted dehydrogenase